MEAQLCKLYRLGKALCAARGNPQGSSELQKVLFLQGFGRGATGRGERMEDYVRSY